MLLPSKYPSNNVVSETGSYIDNHIKLLPYWLSAIICFLLTTINILYILLSGVYFNLN